MKDFYSPREIRFTRKQTLWLLRNMESLRGGHWPPEESSFVDTPIGKKAASNKAAFVTPVEYAAEIEIRMEKAGIDGLILEAIESWSKTVASMANYLRMEDSTIERKYKNALYYVASGPARRWHDTKKRKGETYQEFNIRRKNV